MRLIKVDKKSKYANDIKNIYLSSFPECERIGFEELINCKFPNSTVLGVFDKQTLIGFTFVSLFGKFAYIVYLAIDKNQKNKGFGTMVLTELSNFYSNYTQVLCVEKPLSKGDLQTRRIGFYKRNGFNLANFEFDFDGQNYYSMYKGSFNEQEFKNFLLVCFPACSNFKTITIM